MGTELQLLELVSARPLRSGAVAMHYRRARRFTGAHGGQLAGEPDVEDRGGDPPMLRNQGLELVAGTGTRAPPLGCRVTCWNGSSMVMTRPLSRFFACSSGRSTDGSCGSFMEMLGQQIVMLEAALQEAAGAAGVTLTVENGAILITPPP